MNTASLRFLRFTRGAYRFAKKHNKTLVVSFALISLLATTSAHAISVLPSKGLVPNCERTSSDFGTIREDGSTAPPTNKPCEVKDFFQMLFNLTEWFLAILGSAAFLLFFYGGLLFVVSFGSPQKVEKGRTIMLHTILGIIVILGAYTAVKIVSEAFGVVGRI